MPGKSRMIVNMGNVWDRATEFVSDNLSAIAPIALLAIFLPATLSASIQPIAEQSATAMLVVQIAGLVLTVVMLWGQLAIIALATGAAASRAAATRLATARLPTMLGLSGLLLIGTLLLMVPIPVVLGIGGYDVDAAMRGVPAELPAGASGFVAIYVLILLPLFFFLAARLALLTPIVVRERLGIGAFRRSFALTRGITWKIVGVVLLYGIVFGVAMLAAQFVFGAILQLVAGGEGDISVATVLTAVLVSAVQTAFVVIAAAFAAKLYLASRAARDAVGVTVAGT